MKSKGLEKGTVERNSDDAKGRFIWGLAGGKQGGVDRANRTISGIASTINVDRDGEIILPRAFAARLDKFKGGSSPFMAAHTHWTSTAAPGQIGWVVEISITKIEIPCRFRFVDDTDGVAERWWKLAADPNGKGIAFSIGFIPIRWVYGSVADLVEEFPEIKPAVAGARLADDDRLRVYTEIELLEVSAVPVPSNREAMQLLAAKLFSPGGEGDKAVEQFREDLAGEVVRQLAERGLLSAGEIEKLHTDMAAKLDEYASRLELFVREAIDDVMALLPDTVNADAAGQPGPGRQDVGADAAGGVDGADPEAPGGSKSRPGGVREAAERLRRTAES